MISIIRSGVSLIAILCCCCYFGMSVRRKISVLYTTSARNPLTSPLVYKIVPEATEARFCTCCKSVGLVPTTISLMGSVTYEILSCTHTYSNCITITLIKYTTRIIMKSPLYFLARKRMYRNTLYGSSPGITV